MKKAAIENKLLSLAKELNKYKVDEWTVEELYNFMKEFFRKER